MTAPSARQSAIAKDERKKPDTLTATARLHAVVQARAERTHRRRVHAPAQPRQIGTQRRGRGGRGRCGGSLTKVSETPFVLPEMIVGSSRRADHHSSNVGARVELVPPWEASITCNACGGQNPHKRESEARFRCRECGNEDNADANAGRTVRDRGVAAIRARMHASRGRDRTSSRRGRRRPEERTAGRVSPSREARPAREGSRKAAPEASARQ